MACESVGRLEGARIALVVGWALCAFRIGMGVATVLLSASGLACWVPPTSCGSIDVAVIYALSCVGPNVGRVGRMNVRVETNDVP
jgi:hypothetical protein